ncbi:two-component system OmpR family response regulator [Nitrobacteraceae bacterium AZCC 2161]
MSERTLGRIMYVDDEPDVRKVAKISLELVGKFELCLCDSGREAIAQVQQFKPDLILLDVMMPEMDGPTTLVALRGIQSVASTPIVFMTAKAQSAEIKRYRDLGAVEVFTKPFQPMQLPNQLRELWRRIQI